MKPQNLAKFFVLLLPICNIFFEFFAVNKTVINNFKLQCEKIGPKIAWKRQLGNPPFLLEPLISVEKGEKFWIFLFSLSLHPQVSSRAAELKPTLISFIWMQEKSEIATKGKKTFQLLFFDGRFRPQKKFGKSWTMGGKKYTIRVSKYVCQLC